MENHHKWSRLKMVLNSLFLSLLRSGIQLISAFVWTCAFNVSKQWNVAKVRLWDFGGWPIRKLEASINLLGRALTLTWSLLKTIFHVHLTYQRNIQSITVYRSQLSLKQESESASAPCCHLGTPALSIVAPAIINNLC